MSKYNIQFFLIIMNRIGKLWEEEFVNVLRGFLSELSFYTNFFYTI